jgi:hypothetical protein
MKNPIKGKCYCKPDNSGTTCNTSIDNCAGVNCNSGTCQNKLYDYTCNCPASHSGSHCEIRNKRMKWYAKLWSLGNISVSTKGQYGGFRSGDIYSFKKNIRINSNYHSRIKLNQIRFRVKSTEGSKGPKKITFAYTDTNDNWSQIIFTSVKKIDKDWNQTSVDKNDGIWKRNKGYSYTEDSLENIPKGQELEFVINCSNFEVKEVDSSQTNIYIYMENHGSSSVKLSSLYFVGAQGDEINCGGSGEESCQYDESELEKQIKKLLKKKKDDEKAKMKKAKDDAKIKADAAKAFKNATKKAISDVKKFFR